MKLKIYSVLVAMVILARSSGQQIPNFTELHPRTATFIGNTHGDTVRITPASPNNYHEVESQLFAMPGRGNGVVGLRFGLHGADGGTATFKDITGHASQANAGGGSTIWLSMNLNDPFTVEYTVFNSDGTHNDRFTTYNNRYGFPFFVTYGKNGQSGVGNQAPSAGGGGGSTGMAWITPGFYYYNYTKTGVGSDGGPDIAIAAGGGGGEIINPNLYAAGNGGGVTSNAGNEVLDIMSTCPPYSLNIACGASIMDYIPTNSNYDPCLWGTVSASQNTFQTSTVQLVCVECDSNVNAGLALTTLAVGQPGGQACLWTGGPPPPSGNNITNFNVDCGERSILTIGNAGGSGFTGGGAASEAFENWVGAGGGGTGANTNGEPGVLFDQGISGIINNPAYGGGNYDGGYGSNVSITNGGQVGNPASGWFEYYTIPDTIPPVIHVRNDTVYLDRDGNAFVSGSDVATHVTDNDSVKTINLSLNIFTCYNLGPNRVLVTAVDFAGNTASAWDTITVLNSQGPYYPGQFHYNNPKNIDVSYGPYTLTRSDFPVLYDNCFDTSQLTYTWAPTTFSCPQSGQLENVNFTVTAPDGSSTSSSAPFIIISNFVAQTIYVDSSATGANTGLSWQDAFTNLQDALTLGCHGERTIYIAQGIYYPDRGRAITRGDRTATFYLPDGDQIYGGFPSGGNVFNLRNPAKYPVHLSGAIGNSPASTSSYHVVTIPTGSANIYMEGLNIDSGYANTTLSPDGGGMLVSASDFLHKTRATLVNCNFNGNSAYRSGGAFCFIDTGATGNVKMQNCLFKQNTAGVDGGAVVVNGSTPLQTEIDFTNCVFLNNISTINGGAVYYSNNQSAITNCSFGGNRTGAYGGAIYVEGNDAQVALYNTVMYADTASDNVSREIYESPAWVTLYNCDIQGSGGSGSWNSGIGIDGGNNIDADPQLSTHLGAQNLQVDVLSPLRNRGNNTYNTTALDFNNLPRIEEDTIDIGAYEANVVIYVAADAANGGDGKSWATALNNLQDGLDSAAAASEPVSDTRQVWVKTGTYLPTRFEGRDQGRTNSFEIPFSTKLYGGFAGTETAVTQRNIPANPTILSGDIGTPGDNSDNTYHVVTLDAYDPYNASSPLLDGFIIQGGRADHPTQVAFQNGGAIVDYNNGLGGLTADPSNPIIRNCVFRNNFAQNGGAASFVSAKLDNTITFEQCLFYNNTAVNNGGAVYLQNSSSFATPANAACNFINCTATNNTAQRFSGGFALSINEFGAGNCTCNFYNSIIWGDSAGGVASASENVGTNCSTQNYNSDLQGADPHFVNGILPEGADGVIFTGDDGLKLLSSSPVINGGNNSYLSFAANDSIYDVTGAPRIQQHVVDMGAYEDFGCLGFTSLYVDASVASSGTGGNWGGAFQYLQDALNVAAVCNLVDTIYIAAGTYYPSGTTNNLVSRDTTFFIGRHMVMLGGYPNGGGTRNISTNPVILDGNINTTGSGDNAYHILTVADNNAADNVVLDGLSFRNANANGNGNFTIGGVSFSRSYGGAIAASGPSMVISNCHFYNNSATLGGGCIEDYAGTLTVNNSAFENNNASFGAGIRTEPASGLTANGNTFYHNSTPTDGCALSLYMSDGAECVITSNQFIENTTSGNGAAGTIDGGTSLIYNNTFYNNSATGSGGALYFMPGGSPSLISLFNNIFYKNTASSNNDYFAQNSNVTIAAGLNSSSATNPNFQSESALQGPDGIWGTNDDGLALQNISPLINQGTNFVVITSTDIIGNPRVQLGVVDLGAFESASEITRWYVSVKQDSVTGDGMSWATAFQDIMQAVNLASPGDSIWVAGGVYTPASGTSFGMKSNVLIYGGFNATETDLSQRNLAAGHNSILQGNGSNVIFNDSVNSAVLDGFVIENGTAAVGAGMENVNSSPQVSNCIFTNNSAGLFGGGMSCTSSSPVLTNVVFYNNSVVQTLAEGGAMYIANNSAPVLRNCDFVNNSSTFDGGAIYCLSNAQASIANSAFTGNTAGNLYPDFFIASTQNISYSLLQTGNADSGNIIGNDAGMFDQSNGAGQDGLWFTNDDGLQLVYSNSNLINRGINDSVSNGTDIMGAPRIQNGVVDMGAYESPNYSYCDSASFNHQHILYVDGGVAVSGDGYSWGTAFLTLNEALDKANYCTAFDTILVAAGTYYPTGYQGNTDRTLSFNILRNGYVILGGFPNGGGARNLGSNNTILSGDIGVPDTSFDNSYHVLVFRNTISSIDGFIITNGNANSPNGDANGNGGGAWIDGSGPADFCSPHISNCVFTTNYAYYGGGVFDDASNRGHSSPVFTNCVFAKNTSDGLGAAMYDLAANRGNLSPLITNCTFAENSTSDAGGGIYSDCESVGIVIVTLRNTILWGNTGSGGLADQQFTGNGCASEAQHCIIQGGLSGSLVDGGGNISSNPMFADSANLTSFNGSWMTAFDGLNIVAGSAAINAGSALGAPLTDITGAPRSGLPDIGAYENACSGTAYDTLNITACDSALSPSHRYWWSTAGLYYDTTLTAGGCDTFFTVNLTLGHTTYTNISATSCTSYTSPSGRYIWDTSGVYTDTFTTSTGCDSIIIVTLSVGSGTATSISASACESYTSPSGRYTWTGSGIYNDTLTSSGGCDSVVTITLTINHNNAYSYIKTICWGESYLFNNTNLTAGGVYNDTLTNAGGCDSIVTLTLTVLPQLSSSFGASICSGSSYNFFGEELNAGGTYNHVLTASSGCDSTVTLNLTVNPVYNNSISASICGNGSYNFYGQVLTNAGIYTQTLQTANGCDSIITLHLSVNPVPQPVISGTTPACGSVILTASGGTSYLWSGGSNRTSAINSFTNSGTYTVTVTGNGSCSATASKAITVYASPVVSITGNTSGCGSVTLTATGGGTYSWSGGNHRTSNTNTFTSTGVYTVTVTGTHGCTTSVSTSVSVNTTPVASITGTTTGCGSVALTAAGGTSYAWNGGTSRNTASNTFTASGSYTVTVTAAGGCTATASKTVTVYSAPVVNVTGNRSGCGSVTLTVTGGGTYLWSGGNYRNNSTNTFTNSGIYTVTVTGGHGCTTSVSVSVTVNSAPVATITSSGGNCGSVAATASGGTGYSWSGGTSPHTAANTFTSSGNYRVTVTNASGCTATASISVTVNNVPARPGSISGPVNDVCHASAQIYSISAVSGASSYTWTVPNGVTITNNTGTGIKVNYGNSFTGSGYITVKATNNCGSSAIDSLAISALPAVSEAISGPTTACKTEHSVIYSVPSVSGATYSWAISGGAAFAGSSHNHSVIVNFAAAGSNVVISVSVTNACGSSSASLPVSVSNRCSGKDDEPENGDTASTFVQVFKAYPNPTSGLVHLVFSGNANEHFTFTIMDLLGRVINVTDYTAFEGDNYKDIDLTGLTKGVYLLKISDNGAEPRTLRIVLQSN